MARPVGKRIPADSVEAGSCRVSFEQLQSDVGGKEMQRAVLTDEVRYKPDGGESRHGECDKENQAPSTRVLISGQRIGGHVHGSGRVRSGILLNVQGRGKWSAGTLHRR